MHAINEKQGLQSAVIIFALLTMVMSAATFYVFKLGEDAELRAREENKRASEAIAALKVALAENHELRRMLGTPYSRSNLTLPQMQTIFAQEMEIYGDTMPEQYYSDVLKELKTAYDRLQQDRTSDRVGFLRLVEEVKSSSDVHRDNVAAHRQAAAAAHQSSKDAAVKFAEARNTLVQDNQRLIQQREIEREDRRKELEKAAAAANKAAADLAALRQVKDHIQQQLDEISSVTFAAADGEIRWVSAQTRTVWINLGRDDGLKKLVTFSVYGVDQNGAARGRRKGSIEVTQIVGEHLAEARIVEETLSDPLLIGDQLYTPLWHAGRQQRFAICGQIDFDQDGASDLDLLKGLIGRQGGRWVAELLPDGSIRTQDEGLTMHTRYLIQGEPFSGSEEAYGKMLRAAKELGVEVLSVEKFLDSIGWKQPAPVSLAGTDNFRRRTPLKPSAVR
jgi:hypothetical protein